MNGKSFSALVICKLHGSNILKIITLMKDESDTFRWSNKLE